MDYMSLTVLTKVVIYSYCSLLGSDTNFHYRETLRYHVSESLFKVTFLLKPMVYLPLKLFSI
jgi:hypothetical protein